MAIGGVISVMGYRAWLIDANSFNFSVLKARVKRPIYYVGNNKQGEFIIIKNPGIGIPYHRLRQIGMGSK